MSQPRKGTGSRSERVIYQAQRSSGRMADADPVTTGVVRHGLNSAAEQMSGICPQNLSPIPAV